MTDPTPLEDNVTDEKLVAIYVKGLEFYGFHGVSPEERAIGHRYQVELNLTARTRATETDCIADTVDYGAVAVEVVRFGESSQFQTVERLAQGISDLLMSRHERILEIRLRIEKRLPPAPIIAASAGVELVTRRQSSGPYR